MLTLALLSAAWPHAGAPIEAIDVLLADPAGEGMALEASVGFLWAPEGDAFEWICHEAITAPDVLRAPRYALSTERVMLGRVQDPDDGREEGEGLYRSEDGCDWAPAAGLTGRALAAHRFHPSDPSRAYVVTADVSENDLLYSVDGGQSFAPTELVDVEAQFTSVVVEPGGPVWAAATDIAGGAWLYHSEDGVTGWTAREVEGEGPLTLFAARDGAAWAGFGSLTEQRVLRLSEAGATQALLTEEGEPITDIEVAEDGEVWVAIATGFLWSEDGERFEDAPAPPGLGGALGERIWLATRFELTNYALVVGGEGDGFAPIFTFYDLEGPPARCGAETHVGQICPGDWELLGPRLSLEPSGQDSGDSGASDTHPPDSGLGEGDKPCGCAAGGGGGLWLLGLLAALRRRY